MAACNDMIEFEEANMIQNIETEPFTTSETPEDPQDNPPKDLPETKTQEATIMVLGEIGCGKSSLINSLLGEKVAEVRHGPQSTSHGMVEYHKGTVGEINTIFIDTRGLGDTTQGTKAEQKKFYISRQSYKGK